MTTEFELIRRYRGAFTPEECDKLIDYIDNFEKTNLLVYDTENLHQVDNKTINISNYDFPAYSQLATDILNKFKPCVDEYIEAVSILKPYKFSSMPSYWHIDFSSPLICGWIKAKDLINILV